MSTEFVETLGTAPRPQVVTGFDEFVEELEDAYEEANDQEVDIIPEDRGIGVTYAGPTLAGSNRDSMTYRASTERREATIEVEINDYSHPHIGSMLEKRGGTTMEEPSTNHLRDITLGLEEGSDLLFDLVGDAAYDLMNSHAIGYERDDTLKRRRRFVFEREGLEEI